MKKRKVLTLDVFKNDELCLSTPFGSPDLVIGFLSTFNVPENESMVLEIKLKEIEVPDEKEDN